MLIFLPYMKLYSKTVKKIFLKICQNKIRIPGKNRKCLVYLKEVTSYINYIHGYNFWWDYLDIKHRDTIYLKFGDRFFTPLTI